MTTPFLSIANLEVSVEGKLVLKELTLELDSGQAVFLMGANGGGKSSLANVLLGNPNYLVTKGEIWFDGHNLLLMTPDERAKAGLFVAWQNPIAIPGVSVFNMCRASYEAMGNTIASLTEFKTKLEELAIQVGLTSSHIARNINEGFSGGEKKRLELLQLLLLKPKLAVLDEIDSGIDSEGIKMTVKILEELRTAGTSVILITHNKRLIDEVMVDHTWEISNGVLSTRV